MASKLLLIVKTVFDLVAFCFAVAAEQKRSTATVVQDNEKNYSYCVYDSGVSTNYGVGAFMFLMISQIIILIASRCFCCGKALRPEGSRAWALVLFILCWVTFIIAEACLLAGSVRNAYHTKYGFIFTGSDDVPPSCEMLRKGVFAAGAAFVIFTSILSDFYYLSYSKARESFQAYGKETGVGMGAYSST